MKKSLFCLLSFASLTFADPISPSIHSFGSDFYQECLKEENICFSPYSLFNCLSTAYLGSKSETEEEMAKILHIESDESFPSLLSSLNRNLQSDCFCSADAIWLEKKLSLLDEYKETIQDLPIKVESIDFSDSALSASIINRWVTEKTKNTIKKLLSPSDLPKGTKAVLTNAIHFQSIWQKPFPRHLTAKAEFAVNITETSSINMMHQTNYFPYHEDENCQLLLLPVKSSSSSYYCFFLLPKTIDSDFEKMFTLSNLLNQIHLAKNTYVNVHLPKFSLRKKLDATNILQKLGLQNAFTSKADFSGLVKEQNLHISKVLHEAFFSIEEEGVEASAATAITICKSCAYRLPDDPILFRADHPFLFGIVDLNSDLVLFLGKLTRP